MTNGSTAEEVRALLKLEPHATCGFVHVTFISNQRIAPRGLPAPFDRYTFHTARVMGQRRWFLGASTEWPGVEKVDVEIADVEALAAKHPDVATICAHSREVTDD